MGWHEVCACGCVCVSREDEADEMEAQEMD